MSVKVFYVPFGQRNSAETLFKTALRDYTLTGGIADYSGILYIAPNWQVIAERMRVFHRLVGGRYIPPEMMTLEELSKRLCFSFGNKVIVPNFLRPLVISGFREAGIGLSAITSGFISEIKHLYPTETMDRAGDLISSLLTESGVPQAVGNRVSNAMDTFRQYTSLMQSHEVMDEDDTLLLSPSIIEKKLNVKVLILDGFSEITNAEKSVISQLISKAEKTIISIHMSNNYTDFTSSYIDFINNNFKTEETYLEAGLKANLGAGRDVKVTYHPFPSQEEEVEGIARHIKSAFISGRQRNLDRVVVAFPELDKYRDMTVRVFKRYGIPHTMAEPMPVASERQFLDIFCLLDSIADDYPRLAFMSFLFSPYFQGLPQALKKVVPRLCLSSGIIKGKEQWLKAFKAEGDEVYSAGRKVFKRLEALESIKDKASYTDYLNALNYILLGFGYSPKEDSDVSRTLMVRGVQELREILKWIGLVDSIISKDTDIRGFIDGLRYILEHTTVKPEGTGIQVMSLFNAGGLEPEFLYLGGLKDREIPSLPEMDHLLPDSLRTGLGLTNLKEYLMRQEFMYHRLIASSDGLYLTYPTMDGDKFFLPSLFLRDADEKRDRVSGVFSFEEELLRKKGMGSLSEHIREIRGLKSPVRRFSENSYIHVTDIDGYRRCPRKFFIEKILTLEPPEIKEYELEALTIGSVIHEVMYRLMPCTESDIESFRVRAGSVLNDVFYNKNLEPYWRAFLKESFFALLPEIYRIEEVLRADGFSFKSAEFTLKGEPLKGIRLKGKIDRMDEKNIFDGSVVQVIDYKTGRAELSGSQILKAGESLQLFLYATLIRAHNIRVERVGIYSLRDAHIKWIPNRTDKKTGRSLNDYISAVMGFLEDTVKRMRQGDFSALPLDAETCRHCHEMPYCPYIQGIEG